MSKCLVTGGAGFIGSNLVDRLVELGHKVVVMDNLYSGKKEYLNSHATFLNMDIRAGEVEDVFEGEEFDYVFHLAAQIDARASVREPLFDLDINVAGSLNILENCRKFNIKKIIFVSTGGALFGDDASIVPTPESVLPAPTTPYGIHKLCFEKYLNYYNKIFGQDYIAIRPANVYGPRQYKGGESGVISIFIDKASKGEVCTINGEGAQTRDYVYVDDIVNSLIKGMETDFTGELNIGSGKETSVLDIVELIEEALGKEVNKEHAPAVPGDQMRSCLDSSKAWEVLGWKPQVDLREGIKRTLEWTGQKF